MSSTSRHATESNDAWLRVSDGGRGEEQRRRVLEAAMLAIAEKGVDAVRLSHISERCGMSPGHLLYYFGSKDRILIETLRWSERDAYAEWQTAASRARTARGRLRRFVDLYLPTGPDDPRWQLWVQAVARPPQDEETRRELDELSNVWYQELTDILTAGIAAGDFFPVDVEDVAYRTQMLLDGLAWTVLLGLPTTAPKQARRFATRSIEAELRPHQQPPPKRSPRAVVGGLC